MNKTTFFLLNFCLFLLLLAPVPAEAAIAGGTDPVTVVNQAKVDELEARLDEIAAIDRTTMRPTERRELRQEVRAIKAELKAQGGGVYISVGALLIVIILLILLL